MVCHGIHKALPQEKYIEIRENLNVPNILNEIEKFRNIWLKHLQRTNDNKITSSSI